MRKLIVIVPARSGSKSIADKNLQIIQGHSLLGWAVRAASLAFPGTAVYVDTDSISYAEEGEKYGAMIPFLRPKSLAQDSTTDLESFTGFLEKLKSHKDALVVHLRPTTPLRAPAEISRAVETFEKHGKMFTSLRSVHEMSETAYKTFERSEAGMLNPLAKLVSSHDVANLPRQSFPSTFVANGYVDVFPVSNISQYGTLHGHQVYGFVTPPTLEVDSADDLQLIRLQASVSDFSRIFSNEIPER